MKTGYYEPEIEEFHVGMIYETCEDESADKWQQNTVENLRELKELCGYNDKYIGKYAEIRIKYLDKEDIESLGFVSSKLYNDIYLYKDKIAFFEDGEIYTVGISYSNINLMLFYKTEDDTTINFYIGTIKNKSELIKILQQTNIL